VHPQAVVLAADACDVVATIRQARGLDLRISPRAGGHCFAGRRSSAGDVILDVGGLRSVIVTDEVAVVGAGVRLGELDDTLSAHGLAVPAGCGPTVGVAGLTLGGGLGILGRCHGLTCDQLLGARVVLADGRVVDCDAQRHPDLYWALRGAGGGQCGVVTELRLRAVAAPSATWFRLDWAPRHTGTVLHCWQQWAPSAPDQLTLELRLTAAGKPGPGPIVTVLGAALGTAADSLLDAFIAEVGEQPIAQQRQTLPYHAAKRELSRFTVLKPDAAGHGRELSRSHFFRQPLPHNAVTSVPEHLIAQLGAGQCRQLSFTPWGGAYNRVPAATTAFAHRRELFLLEHVATLPARALQPDLRAARAWLDQSWTAVRPWAAGTYLNFPDPHLDAWATAYHGTNYTRLQQVKRSYDPDNYFRFPQSIKPAGARRSLTRPSDPSATVDAQPTRSARSR